MYKGIPFSPQVALADGIGTGDTTIPVTDISAFPDAPNLATIGTDEDGETILYAAKTTDSLSGCTRGVEGTAKAWPSGTTIARNFTNKDFDALQKNIQETKTQANQGVSDAADAKSAAAAAQNTANAASSAASGAQSTADTASTAASNAQTAADNAQTTADKAQTAAAAVQSDLNEHTANAQNPHGVTAEQAGAATASHKHGNLTNDGKLGSTANLPVFTGTNGLVQTVTAISAAAKLGRGYGTCSTAAATKAKVVTLSSFILVTGAIIGVKFSYDNTATTPTLNVNSTGAKSIYYKGEAAAAKLLKAGYVYLFQYNGSQYELLNPVTEGSGSLYPMIIATVPTGSTVTVTDGETVLVGTEASGKWAFQIPSYGTWIITATLSGQTASTRISVTEVKQYNIALTYKPAASTSAISGIDYTTGISSLTAAKMSEYSEAISNNNAITSTTSTVYIIDGTSAYRISVGDSINIAIGGTSYAFKIMGFNHDTLTSSTAYGSTTVTGKAGMTLQMVNCLSESAQMNNSASNVGGWKSCIMRTTNMETYLNQFTSAWQNVIKQVDKLSSAGNQSATINTTNDKLFLMSEVEIFGSTSVSFSGEGSQYAYYKAGNSKIKYMSSYAVDQWIRSPYTSSTGGFCSVTKEGATRYYNAQVSIYIAFGFCV